MDTVKKVLDTLLAWFTIVLFAVLVLVVVWQVASRELVGTPSTWSEEAARQLFVWLGFLASAYVFSTRGHIAVEFVVRKLPERAERVVAILVQALILTFAVVVLVWGGWRASQGAWGQNLSALPFTIGQMYLAMPVAGVLIALYCVYFIVAMIRREEPPYLELALPAEAAEHTDATGTVRDEGGPDHVGTSTGTDPSTGTHHSAGTHPSAHDRREA
ncbi:TRAP transporter small permease [Georgenia faecalis]|uniref:TRAP transporter small permease n=1 Tax=Georgenia faecalis TaxID=2483799 RepID=A0ABV9D7J2_9MICO|nr:TRAP transporter small permease [Georgenia faecalis]